MKKITSIIPLLAFVLLVPAGIGNVIAEEMTDAKEQRIMDLFEKANIVQEKITKQENKAIQAQTQEIRDYHLAKVEKLKNDLANIDRKINKLAPITEQVTGESQKIEPRVFGEGVSRHTIVSFGQQGCDGSSQQYLARMAISAPSDSSYWSIDYTDPISVGWKPFCFDSSFVTYEIIIQNHSDGWTCASNNIVDAEDTFRQLCSGKIMSDGDLLKVSTIAHYSSWTIEKSKYIVV